MRQQRAAEFQCSSASRKFLNTAGRHDGYANKARGFSALQRAENSSIKPDQAALRIGDGFQCSSASRKFLNPARGLQALFLSKVSVLFSEPKIPQFVADACHALYSHRFQCSSASRKFLNLSENDQNYNLISPFQCSSASRKFLNWCSIRSAAGSVVGFSALQRAENSSMFYSQGVNNAKSSGFSALQRAENSSIH